MSVRLSGMICGRIFNCLRDEFTIEPSQICEKTATFERENDGKTITFEQIYNYLNICWLFYGSQPKRFRVDEWKLKVEGHFLVGRLCNACCVCIRMQMIVSSSFFCFFLANKCDCKNIRAVTESSRLGKGKYLLGIGRTFKEFLSMPSHVICWWLQWIFIWSYFWMGIIAMPCAAVRLAWRERDGHLHTAGPKQVSRARNENERCRLRSKSKYSIPSNP